MRYAWGSTEAIPAWLGIEPDGEPWAELWLGAHPAGPATLGPGTSLVEHLTAHPAMLGDFDHLPYMVKLLAAAKPLSLQVHPSAEQARAGFARENALGIPTSDAARNYKDDRPKPEIMIATDTFDALCGFRQPEAIASEWEQLDVAGLGALIAILRGQGAAATRIGATFRTLTQLPAAEAKALVGDVIAAANSAESMAAGTIRTVGAYYPADIGVVLASMLNRLTLARGDAIFLAAQVVHAYLEGHGIEVMGNSDNVLRGGLTPKHVDVVELERIVDFTPWDPVFVQPKQVSPGVSRLDVPAPEFAVWQIDVAEADQLPGDGTPRIVLSLDAGTAVGGHQLQVGDAVFVGASENAIQLAGTGQVVMASPGQLA